MNYTIQEITPQHDIEISKIIKMVGKEFGAVGDGFGPSDAEVNAMSRHYKNTNASRYFIASIGDQVVGGGGIASFNNSHEVCELRKLFLIPESRGLGIGKRLIEQCLEYAKSKGYKRCYLDTLANMTSAIVLYKKFEFQHLDNALAGSIHNGCDVWMLKEL